MKIWSFVFVLGLLGVAGASAALVPFMDSFEDGIYSGGGRTPQWTNITASSINWSVVNNYSAVGNRSIEYTGTATHLLATYAFANYSMQVGDYVEGWIRQQDASATSAFGEVRFTNRSGDNLVFGVGDSTTHSIYMQNGSGATIAQVSSTVNTWYRGRITRTNTTHYNMSFHNSAGTHLGSNLTALGNFSIDRTVLYGFSNNAATNFYYDNVTYNISEDTTPYNLTINATDAYDGSNINTFNATITGTGDFVSLLDKSGNGNNLTNNGATYNTTEKSFFFDSTDNLRLTNAIPTITNTGSYSQWIKPLQNSSASFFATISTAQATLSGTRGLSGFQQGSSFQIGRSNGSISQGVTMTNVFRDLEWVHLTAVFDGINLTLYRNGVFHQSSVQTVVGDIYSIGAGYIGDSGASGSSYNGSIGLTGIWNRSLSAAEVATVYANGTVSDGLVAWYDFNDYGTVTLSTTNGTINSGFTANNTQPANITVEATNYFSSSINGFNGSLFSASLSQAVVGFTASEVITNTSVTDFTVSVPGLSNTSSSPVLYLNAGTYNVTFNKTGWFNITQEVTVTGLTSSTVNIDNVYRYVLNITAIREVLLTREYVFSITAQSGLYSYNITLNTTTGNISIPWTNDTNLNLTFENSVNLSRTTLLWNTSNYTSLPATVSIQITSLLTNSFLMSFVDENTGALITGTNITAYLTGTVISYNYSTNNGYINATIIYPQVYVITYGGGSYPNRQYVIELENQTSRTLVLYLLANSTGTNIRFTVLDQTYQTLQGAVIDAQRKNLSGTNYYNVADCTTDNNGECILFLETLTATYRFVTDYETTTRTTADTVLSRDTYTIVLNIGTSTLQEVLGRDDITANLNYTAPDSFYYTVNDETGNVNDGLLVIERRYGGRWTTISSSTGSGSSFTISSLGVNTTVGDEVRASGYVYVDGQPILTHQVSVIESSAGSALGDGLIFMFLGMMFTIVFIFAWNPVAPLVVFGAFLLIMSRVGIVAMGAPAVVAVIIVIVIAVYRMRSV